MTILCEMFPEVAKAHPRIPLASGAPTAVQAAKRLGERIGVPGLLVKRDDRTSFLYGGNKVRKLEWLLGRARAEGRRRVVTLGAWGSHHALATAIFAREAGLRATLVLYPQPLNAHVLENIRADLGAGADLQLASSIATVPFALARAIWSPALRGEGRAHVIPAGGSDPLGTLGYVECALEIAADVRAGRIPAPDFVHAAAGTCGTAAGLALGLAIAARETPALAKTRIVGTRVVPAPITTRRKIVRLAKRCAHLMTAAGVKDLAGLAIDATLVTGELGPGYGKETDAAREVAAAALEAEGIALDTTYTAKALAGVRSFAKESGTAGAVHLFVHTLSAVDVAPLAAQAPAEKIVALPANLRA